MFDVLEQIFFLFGNFDVSSSTVRGFNQGSIMRTSDFFEFWVLQVGDVNFTNCELVLRNGTIRFTRIIHKIITKFRNLDGVIQQK